MIPWKPPPPVPRKRPFQLFFGSHTSILIEESLIGVSVAVTRQKGGRPLKTCVGLLGFANTPVSLSAADVIMPWWIGRPARLVQGVAAAGAAANMAEVNSATAELTSRGRQCMVTSPP